MNREEFTNKLDELVKNIRSKEFEEKVDKVCKDQKNEVLSYLESQDDYLVKLLEWAPLIQQLSEDINNSDRDMETVVKLRMIYSGMIREIGTRTCMIFEMEEKND